MRLVRGASRLKLGDVRARARGDRSRSGGASRTGTLPRPEPGRPGPGANGGGGRRRLVRIRGDGRDRERRFAHRRRRQWTRRRPRRTRGTRSRDDEERASVARHAPGRVRVRGARVADGDVESHVDGGGEPPVGFRAQPRTVCREKRVVPRVVRAPVPPGRALRFARVTLRAEKAGRVRGPRPDAGRGDARARRLHARGDDAALVASIRASRDVFERLDAMGAESDEDKADGARSESAGSDLASRSSDSSDSDDSDSDDSDADAPLSPRRRKPSREWMRAIRSRLSLDATLRLARQPPAAWRRRRRAAARKPRPFAPRPFVGSRAPRPSAMATRVALGLVLLRETQAVEGDMSRTFAPLFDANRVRLFRVTRVRRRKD